MLSEYPKSFNFFNSIFSLYIVPLIYFIADIMNP